MDKLIIVNKKGVDFKNIYISADGIKALDKNVETKEYFCSSFSEKLDQGLNLINIPFDCVESVCVYSDDFGLQIKYIKGRRVEISYLEFDSFEDLTEVKHYIIFNSKLKIIDTKKMYGHIVKKRYIISMVFILLMIICFFFLALPRFTLIIIILASGGFIYWLKLAQMERSIVQEKYIGGDVGSDHGHKFPRKTSTVLCPLTKHLSL